MVFGKIPTNVQADGTRQNRASRFGDTSETRNTRTPDAPKAVFLPLYIGAMPPKIHRAQPDSSLATTNPEYRILLTFVESTSVADPFDRHHVASDRKLNAVIARPQAVAARQLARQR
jgi:hypothetical protein